MNNKKLRGRDILLILLYLPGKTDNFNEPIIGRTRITKMMFIFNKELYKRFEKIDADSLPDFFAYDYGPFSKDLLTDLRFFETIGFIENNNEKVSEQLSEAEFAEYLYDINDDRGFDHNLDFFDVEPPEVISYQLTDQGSDYVKNNLLKHINSKQVSILQSFKTKINSLTLDAILSYVYNKYPDSARNSKIKNKYLSNVSEKE